LGKECFLRRGRTRADLNSDGKTPSDRQRLMSVVMGCMRASIHDLRRKVGIMSREQEALDDLTIALRTSTVDAGEKERRAGGGVTVGMCGDTFGKLGS
jgi:hypothetical protein